MIKLKLEFKCIIGCLDFERKKPQKVKIKLKIKNDDFIDYAEISDFIYAKMKEKKFIYIEDALKYFELKLKEKYPKITKIKLQIAKPQIFKLCNKEYLAKPSVSFKKIY